MFWLQWLAGLLASGLAIYLLFALLRPEGLQ